MHYRLLLNKGFSTQNSYTVSLINKSFKIQSSPSISMTHFHTLIDSSIAHKPHLSISFILTQISSSGEIQKLSSTLIFNNKVSPCLAKLNVKIKINLNSILRLELHVEIHIESNAVHSMRYNFRLIQMVNQCTWEFSFKVK